MRLAAVALVFVACSANAAPKSDVIAQLKRIPSVAGGSVYERIQRCGIRIENESGLDDGGSFAKEGEKQLNVFIDVPPLTDTAHDRALFRSLNAIWVIPTKGMQATPATGWAKDLQSKPVPLGSASWLNC